MITIRSIEEMLLFYASLGGKRQETKNGFCYTFPDGTSYVRFWGDLHGFSAASVDCIYPEDAVIRMQFQQRYFGISLIDEGATLTYHQEDAAPASIREGINCFVADSPTPLFMKIPGGKRLKFKALYFQEDFFRDNNIHLHDNFWRDAKNSLGASTLHSPELISVYHRIEQSRLTGLAFETWVKGQGLSAAGYLIDLVQQFSSQPPIYLDEQDIEAVEKAKSILRQDLQNAPTIISLCKIVGMNKNKLQEGFRLTEGKSIAEYTRTLRMEYALDLLEADTMSVYEIANAVGYYGVSGFYRAFRQTFGETPMAIRDMLKRIKA